MIRYFYHDIALAFRVAVLAFSFVMGVIVLIACASVAGAATLKTDATLTKPYLTAGDLFDGLDNEKAAKLLGPAPQPGQDMTLNTMTLMQVAAALSIDWKPQSTADQITVRSASTLVDQQTIIDALSKELQKKGITGKFSLSFFDAPKLILPKDAPATAEVASLSYHAESDRFEATLVGPDKEHPTARAQVSGHLDHTMSIPVLRKAMRGGDIIRADNITWKDMPQTSVNASTLLDADKIIGLTPRRMVMAGQAVMQDDVTQPLLVSRGETVTIMYEKGPITVTAKGKALEDGARGALIRVSNVASARSIEATVSDDGIVTVMN